MVRERTRDKETSSSLKIRLMVMEDLPQVITIERESYRSPWSLDDFVREITANTRAQYFVALEDNLIVGFVGTWLLADEGHITNVAVTPEKRGKGYGKILTLEALKSLQEKQASYVILEVRASNKIAVNLYKSLGFRVTQLRKGYYMDNNEDAYVMIKDFRESDENTGY
ncbi:MAG: Ribosomal-protein-alanine acetyltransferase [candidate division WS2 bacterium]|nr:Ribosomal-protein-alanine acetyltransferase [Candidatus Lithacetigena glycinireducens]MBT9175090.1 Ribosomal-protein-alanine acetyltransferase [Candidatus Lithacetigena glycinireducens]